MLEEEFQKIIQLSKNGYDEQVEISLAKFIKKYPEFVPASLWLGDIFLNSDKVKEALKLLRKTIKVDPFNGWAKFLFAEALLKVNRFYLAREYLMQAKSLLPNEAEVYRSLGWAEIMIGNVRKGQMVLKKALRMSPDNVYIYTDLAASEGITGNFDQAKKWLKKAFKLNPQGSLVKNLEKSIKINQKSFNTFSLIEQNKIKNSLKKNKANIVTKVNLLLGSLGGSGDQDDLEEVAFELRKIGVSGEINIFDEKDKLYKNLINEYLRIHQQLDREEKKNKIKFSPRLWSKILFDQKKPIRDKKKVLVLLARQGNKKSLTILKEYLKQPEKKLVKWSKMAIDECWARLEAKTKKQPVVRIKRIIE